MKNKLLLTIPEAAEELGISYMVVRKWTKLNCFKVIYSGRRCYINRESLYNFINKGESEEK